MICRRKVISAAIASAALLFAGSARAQPAQAPVPFAQEINLTPQTIVYLKGAANWDTAFETILESLKTVYGFLDKQGIKASGPAMVIYTATDDTGFEFQAAVPIPEAPQNPPQGDLAVTTSPSGKALK